MDKVMPMFKDDTDKLLTIVALIASIFFPPLPFLILFFLKNNLSENSFAITKGFLNFGILLFIIYLFCWIPIIGWIVALLLCPILFIVNAIFMLMAVFAVLNQSAVKIPKVIQFIK